MEFVPIRVENAPQIEIAAGAKLVVFHFPKKDGFTNPAWYLTYYDEKRRGNANISLRERYKPGEDVDPALLEKATELLTQRLKRLAKDLPASEKTFMQTA